MGLLRVFKDRYRNYCMRNHDTTAFHGLDVQVRRSGMIAPILHQIWFDACELLEIAGLSVAIHPGDRVLELGAGLGIISALAGRATGPTGQVRSYEANPALHADTQAFFAANAVSNVTLVNAVLVSDGELTPR